VRSRVSLLALLFLAAPPPGFDKGIAFHWAHNLSVHRTAEAERCVSWYQEMSRGSSVVLARDVASVR